MNGIINPKIIAAAAILGLMSVSGTSYSRVNSVTGGIGTSYDYSDRSYDSDRTDSDDYQRISLRPMIDFVSTSEKDRYQFRAAPSIKYDLDNEETDWDSNITVAADRYIYERWQLKFSDSFIRSDYYDEYTTLTGQLQEPAPAEPGLADPTLSTDLGRKRYWKNTLNVSSNHFYQQDSLFRVGFNYIALRNDDSGIRGYDDYDRYVVNVYDAHRFNAIWKTTVDLNYVVGNYDELQDSLAILPVANDNLARDLDEYRVLLGVENDSIKHNPISLNYSYIETNYDESLRDDIFVHQARVSWKREYSPHVYTRIGAGPSYSEAEGSDGSWGGNGIAELNYQVEHGSFNFKLDKRYEVENFSGNFERGTVDAWNSYFTAQYQLRQDLSASGRLSYLYEDRENQFSEVSTLPNSYHKDVYIAGLGLGYNFWRYYTASINYDYINQESDRIDDSYDEHRILLTLSWQKELYRW